MVTSPLRIGSEQVPTTPRRNPSLTDVAEAAGVSMQTVSRVSNGLDNVQPSTRLHVEAAMKRLGYRPNRAARALRTGRFRSIGVVVFTLESFGNMRTVEAITAAAAAAATRSRSSPPRPAHGRTWLTRSDGSRSRPSTASSC